MQFDRRKSKATATALLLMFAITISLVALPNANAQARPTKATYAFIGAIPNPAAVNQIIVMHVGITDQNVGGVGFGWTGLSVTITRPDGVVDTISGIMTDSTGGVGVQYTPTMAGNYTLQTHFPEQVYMPSNVTYKASDSPKLTLVVGEEPLQYYPDLPLPTQYWTRPIDPQLRSWHSIAGSWTEDPYNLFAVGNDDAPETAHILWTTPLTSAGLVGGDVAIDVSLNKGPVGYDTGDAYEGKWIQRFIVGGKLYYQKYATSDPYKELVCVDLHTGEQLWSKVLLNNLTVSFAQLMYWQTYDFMGVYDYLWCTGNSASLAMVGFNMTALNLTSTTLGTVWCAFDPFTGDFVWALYGTLSGTRVMGQRGEILLYNLNMGTLPAQTTGWMTLWNGSNIPGLYSSRVYNSMGWGQWKAMGRFINATEDIRVTFNGTAYVPYFLPVSNQSGYIWNVTIPKGLTGSVRRIFAQDRIIGASINTTAVRVWGLNINESKGTLGQLLFDNTWNAPAEWAAGNQSIEWMCSSNLPGEKVATLFSKETCENYGFSLETGAYMWGPSERQMYLDSLDDTKTGAKCIAYGNLYSASISGIVYCFNVTTGKLTWKYEAEDPYTEFLWSNNWWARPVAIADGKIYVGEMEHSVNQPQPRGAPFYCLNATTGELIWRINGAFRQTRWGGRGIMGDSIIATMDTYDQRVYAIGRGPSATTVSIQNDVITHGGSMLVKGMVTDISPGTKSAGLAMQFPNGVPAVADENQSDWMLYVYKQFPRPTTAVGVEVVLSVLDPNNNCYEVGRATSDANGFYSCAFTPEVPGKYTIYANFAGSKAYWGSSAETAINVEEAPAATPAPTPTPAPMTDTYVMGFGIAMVIAIVVIGLVIILLLRKR
jgi:outer membrane protein assembly factor BamB